MQKISDIEGKIVEMAGLTLKMWQKTFEAFMKHDMDLLAEVLVDENDLNALEKDITSALIAFSRASSDKEEKANATLYIDVAGDLEMIGDYCKDILERVQIKIDEKLLFSEEAVKEYSQLYHKTEEVLREATRALEKNDYGMLKATLKQSGHVDGLVDEYRERHNQRLVAGICSPLAGNMFLNMLDFTAQVYHHTNVIIKNLLKIK